MQFTHYAYSDDSKHKDGRYNSLAIATLKREKFDTLNTQLEKLLKDSGVTDEFKWEKLRNAKYRLAAGKIIDFIFSNQDSIRIDIVVWDLEDKRHRDLVGRDDSENLVRMYYHLVSSTLSFRWPIVDSVWKWHPDVQSLVDWKMLQDCINNKKHACVADLFHRNPDFERVNLNSIIPSNSEKHPLIQVSDLFAGMAAYSFGHYDKYNNWRNQNDTQTSLFDETRQEFSNSEKERFAIIKKFNQLAKDYKLQIAFNSTKGFRSHNPRNFFNFWLYQPQHDNDKAPTINEQQIKTVSKNFASPRSILPTTR
jgi:hypothetical protein